MYKLIKGNQANFEELLNKFHESEIIDFSCNNDASYFVALVKIDKVVLEKEAKAAAAEIKAVEALKQKEEKAKIAAKKAALKKELEAMEATTEV